MMRKTEAKPRLWIIDDESDFTSALTSALLRIFEIETFKNPGEALSLLKEGTSSIPDAILTDLRMPRIDGLEMVRRLRELQLKIPVILVSGDSEKEQLAEALNLGVRYFLEKPFPIERLKEILEEVVSEEVFKKALSEKAARLEQLTQSQAALVDLFSQRQASTQQILQQMSPNNDAELSLQLESRPEYSESIKTEIILRAQIQKLAAESPLEQKGKRIHGEREREKKPGNSNSAA